ncbi:MAG: hypothetical protein H0X24_17290 [Ktedonobacterales bacterium]|nr:hypothetical protein [Ktedonobacterales bacterium]
MNKTIPAATLSHEQQIELTLAYERGTDAALVREWLGRYPVLSDDIITFVLALRVLDGPDVALEGNLEAAIDRGMARGVASAVAATPTRAWGLREALKSANLTKSALARQLRLGLDVVDKFVQGQINLATVPQRFFAELATALDTQPELAFAWAQHSTGVRPANLRAEAGMHDEAPAVESFADAIAHSPAANMSADARTYWLAD